MADVFVTHVEWSGGRKGPTVDPTTFSRDLELVASGQALPMSAAPSYRGDAARANPEQLFAAALSSCQALTYLFHAAKHRIAVVAYEDDAEGHLGRVDGRIRMTRVVLRPRITIAAGSDPRVARELVDTAHHDCFVANSVTSTVEIEPLIQVEVSARP